MVALGATRRMSNMPKAHPKEFRDDAVAVAQRREDGVTINRLAEAFLQNWLRKAEIETEYRLGTTSAESAELSDLRKHNRLLKQGTDVLRFACACLSQANLSGKALLARERPSR